MISRTDRRFFLPILLILVLIAPAVLAADLAPGAESRKGPAVEIKVKVDKRVADLRAADVESHLTAALARMDCECHLARPDEKPDLLLVFELRHWRERRTPGGAAEFDTRSGRYRPGSEWEAEIGYGFEVRDAASGKVLREKSDRFRESAKSHANPLWEPRVEMRRQAEKQIIASVRRHLCKVVRKWNKASR